MIVKHSKTFDLTDFIDDAVDPSALAPAVDPSALAPSPSIPQRSLPLDPSDALDPSALAPAVPLPPSLSPSLSLPLPPSLSLPPSPSASLPLFLSPSLFQQDFLTLPNPTPKP
jgi:hypothetical protein